MLTSMQRKIDITRLDDVPLNQVVTAVQQVDQGTIAFVFGDGAIHLHDAMTMSNLHNEQELGKATTLSKAGFAFQSLQPEAGGLHLSLSPNACLATVLDVNGKVQCRDMRLWQTSQNDEDQDCQSPSPIHPTEIANENSGYRNSHQFSRSYIWPCLSRIMCQ